jgi:hypothetical protein
MTKFEARSLLNFPENFAALREPLSQKDLAPPKATKTHGKTGQFISKTGIFWFPAAAHRPLP